MSSPTGQQQASGTDHSRVVQKSYAKASITISSTGIVRNEVKVTKHTSPRGKNLETTQDIFNPDTYSLVDDINRHDPDARARFVGSKSFEMIIDPRSLLGKGITTLDQFSRIACVHGHIERVRVVLRIPYHSPFHLSQDSTQRQFLLKFVAMLRTLTSLRTLDIVIALPGNHKQWGYDWIMPFYDLETFTGWNLLIKENGEEVNVLAEDHDAMDLMWEEIKERRRREESKNWQVVNTIPSQEPLVQEPVEDAALTKRKQEKKDKMAADKKAKEEAERKEQRDQKDKLKKKV